jgi:hypothetical protein
VEDPDADARIIYECILQKYVVKAWTRFIWLRTGSVAGSCEHDYEPSVSIKGGGGETS